MQATAIPSNLSNPTTHEVFNQPNPLTDYNLFETHWSRSSL